MFTGAKEELLLLKQAIIKYRQKTNPEFKQITVYDEPTVSWKEVKETIIQAKACENGQDNESWSARAHCDKIVDNISVLEAWLGLLPDGDYGAVVGGVFKMIVGVSYNASIFTFKFVYFPRLQSGHKRSESLCSRRLRTYLIGSDVRPGTVICTPTRNLMNWCT